MLLLTEHALYFRLQVRGSLFKAFARDVARKTSHANILTNLADDIIDQLLDGEFVILNEGLIVKARLLVEVLELSFNDLLDDVLRLARRHCLFLIDLALAAK